MAKNVLRSVTDTLRITKKEDPNKPETREVAVVGINDRYSSYPSKGLTPERLASLLQQADTGDVYAQMELFEEMLEKDGKLQGVFGDRRLAVTRRNYQIVAGGEDDKSLEIADDVKKLIDSIPDLDRVKGDILDAVPKGFSVSELFWQVRDTTYVLDRVRWKHQKKFRFGKVSDPLSDPEELRFVVDPLQIDELRGIVNDEELKNATTDGISIESNPRIRKRFAICYCQARSGHPARTSLLRTLAYLWLFKNWDVKWWVMFAERLLGIRIGKYDTNDPTQKDLLVSALRKLGQDTAAVISKDSEIEFVEWLQKAATHQVYGDVAEWVDDQYAIVVLGHTGSSKSTAGKLGNEQAAVDVKQEIVESDAKVLDATINDDIIKVYVIVKYGVQENYPYHKTDVGRALNLLDEVRIDNGLQRLGFPLTKKYVADKYNRPLPGPDDEILVPPAPASGFGSDPSLSLQASKKKTPPAPVDNEAYESQLDTVIDNSIQAAPDIYKRLKGSVSRDLRSVGSFDEAIALVSNYPPSDKFLSGISKLIQNGLETGDALGRSLIIGRDAHYSHKAGQLPGRTIIGKKILSYAATQWVECDNSVKLSYSAIPEEALKILQERALTISGIEQQELLDHIKTALIDAVNNHETWADFNKQINTLFDSYGVTALHPGHLQTVFRTNLASAYSQGQLSQVLAMPDRFPMWQYSAIHDYRTRPSHMALDGNVYRVGEGPLPPIDYNCRCSAIYLHVYDTETRSVAPQQYVGDPMVPFDNYNNFAGWLRGKQNTLSPALRDWITTRSN